MMLRPMRPKPLMPTLMGIHSSKGESFSPARYLAILCEIGRGPSPYLYVRILRVSESALESTVARHYRSVDSKGVIARKSPRITGLITPHTVHGALGQK